MMTRELARIDSIFFGLEDHGILGFNIGLDFGGVHHSFPGLIGLDDYSEDKKRRIGTAAGLDFIIQILRFFKVRNLDDIVGKNVYALYPEGRTIGSNVLGLELPKFDGGRIFMLEDWRKEWFEES
jgi:hypothetical protein